MPLHEQDFAHMPSPIARFRDVAQEQYGLTLPGMVADYYAKLGLAQGEARERQRHAVTTRDAWQAERERLRQAYQQALGPFPAAQVAVEYRGVIERPGLRIHQLLYATHDGNWVPANLYLPRDAASPMPAIVLACGHSHIGKIGYGAYASLLARNGYAAFTYDWPGMGERQLTPHAPYAAATYHNIIGDRLPLVGCSLGWFMVQETMAAITVLQGRPEIDPERIGITGASGGGWLTVHAAALDERLKVAVPAAAVNSLRFHIQADDSEQVFFDMLNQGLHYPDLIGYGICPRPVFVVTNSHDIWGIDGTEYAVREAARCYELLGAGERIGMRTWDRGHNYDADQFVVAMQWFNRWLRDDPETPVETEVSADDVVTMPELAVCREANLYAEGLATPNTVFWDFASTNLCQTKPSRDFFDMLKTTVRLPKDVVWHNLDHFVPGLGLGRRIAFQPEDGLLLPAEVLIPEQPRGILLLVDECDRREDLEWQMQGLHDGYAVFRPDLRGWGETSLAEDYADWEGWSRSYYDSRWRTVHGLALLVGHNLVFDRARDLLALRDVAAQLLPNLSITVWGKRQGALVALYAALADPRITRLRLDQCLASYRDLMRDDLPLYRPEGNVFGLLNYGVDIPDLLAAYAGELLGFTGVDGCLRPATLPKA